MTLSNGEVDCEYPPTTDVELTGKGIEQAKALAHMLSDKEIDLIISSPLRRAVATSRIVSEICNILQHR